MSRIASSDIVSRFLADGERCRLTNRKTARALARVLRRLPQPVLEDLLNGLRPLYVGQSKRITGVVALGQESPLAFLTLSEALERRPTREIMGVLAHELAHLALGHGGSPRWEGRRPFLLREEQEADALACHWGFEEEISALRGRIKTET